MLSYIVTKLLFLVMKTFKHVFLIPTGLFYLPLPQHPTWLSTFLLCYKFYLVRCLSLLIYSQEDLNQNFCYTRICWIQIASCIAEWMMAFANYIHLPSLYFVKKKQLGINTLLCAFTPYSPIMHQKFWILNKEKFLFI